jgi:predicted oxidoreductase
VVQPEDEYERREWDAWIARRVDEMRETMLSTGLRGMPLTRYLRQGGQNARRDESRVSRIA